MVAWRPINDMEDMWDLIQGLAVVPAGWFDASPLSDDAPLKDAAFFLMSGICPQRPGHSYFFDGLQFPIESREAGIFIGALISMAAGWLSGARSRRMPLWVWPLLTIMFLAMAIDGVNSTLNDIGLGFGYVTSNELRLMTGLSAGIAVGLLLAAVWTSLTAQSAPLQQGMHRRWLFAVAGAAGGAAIILGLHLISAGPAYWPLALLLIGGVLTLLTMLHLMVWLVNRPTFAQTANRGRWVLAITAGVGLAVVELSLLAGIRILVETATGLQIASL